MASKLPLRTSIQVRLHEDYLGLLGCTCCALCYMASAASALHLASGTGLLHGSFDGVTHHHALPSPAQTSFAILADAYSLLLGVGVPAVAAHVKAHACLRQRRTAFCWSCFCLSPSCLEETHLHCCRGAPPLCHVCQVPSSTCQNPKFPCWQ